MTYRVDLSERAFLDLQHIYLAINAHDSTRARAWFNGLQRTVESLNEHPDRSPLIPEGGRLRHLLYGRKGRRYRIIYAVDERRTVVTVLHIRHGARDAFEQDDQAG